jgi:hypothetical protein
MEHAPPADSDGSHDSADPPEDLAAFAVEIAALAAEIDALMADVLVLLWDVERQGCTAPGAEDDSPETRDRSDAPAA